MASEEIDENGRLTTGENVEEFIARKVKEDPECKAIHEALDPNDENVRRAFAFVFSRR